VALRVSLLTAGQEALLGEGSQHKEDACTCGVDVTRPT
jgi:hypothetical protein